MKRESIIKQVYRIRNYIIEIVMIIKERAMKGNALGWPGWGRLEEVTAGLNEPAMQVAV